MCQFEGCGSRRRKVALLFKKAHQLNHKLRAQLVHECKDANDDKCHDAFQNLFAPFVRVTTEEDLQRAEAFDTKFDEHRGQSHMRQRYVDTALTKEEAEHWKGVTLPEGVSWRDVVHALHTLELSMYYHSGGDNVIEPPGNGIECFVVDTERVDEEGLHLLTCFHSMPMVSIDYPGYFEVDIYKHAVTLQMMDTAHQVEVLYHIVGKPSPNLGTDSYHFDFATREPSTGSFICLVEGLCAWNPKFEQYELVYPISALRSLYGWCEQQLLTEAKETKR